MVDDFRQARDLLRSAQRSGPPPVLRIEPVKPACVCAGGPCTHCADHLIACWIARERARG